MKRAPRSRQRHDLYAKYHDYDSEISDLLGECGVMGYDRINAAYAMINSVDPDGVKKLQWGGQFYNAGGGEISACAQTAKKTGKDQKCTITVPAPAKP